MANNPYGFTDQELASRSVRNTLHRTRRQLEREALAAQKLAEADRRMKQAQRATRDAFDAAEGTMKPRVSVYRAAGDNGQHRLQPRRKPSKDRPSKGSGRPVPPLTPAGGLAVRIDGFAEELQDAASCLKPTFRDDERRALQGSVTRLRQQLAALTKKMDTLPAT